MEDSNLFTWLKWPRVVITAAVVCSGNSPAQKGDSIKVIAYEEEAYVFPVYLFPLNK